jgi:predicted SAM-dependent methyltransferase
MFFSKKLQSAVAEVKAFAAGRVEKRAQDLRAEARALIAQNTFDHQRWIDGRIEARAQDLRSEAHAYIDEQMHPLMSGLRSSLRSYAETISQSGRDLREEVEQRLAFFRRELLQEMQAANSRGQLPLRAQDSPVEARILDTNKLSQMQSTGVKLNVGCGRLPMDGYFNVDRCELPGIDAIAEATSLPFGPNEVQEIVSSHLVEHFSAYRLERVLLPYWREILRPGGKLATIALDGVAMLEGFKVGQMTFENCREVLFGEQDHEGDCHYNLLSPEAMKQILLRCGFVHVEILYDARRNGKYYEFLIEARKA